MGSGLAIFVLTTYADITLFLLLSVALWFWFDRMYLREPGAALFRTRVFGAVIIFAACCAIFSLGLESYQRSQMASSISGFAPTHALELQHLNHAAIRDASQRESAEYLAIIDRQEKWLKLNPTAHDIYTMRRIGREMPHFIVDAATDYDRNGLFEGEREQRTEIGEIYSRLTPNMEMAFQGAAVFDDQPYQDRWGMWVSAYAPILDAKGNVDGIVGVDFSAMEWIATLLVGRSATLLIGFAIIGCLLGCLAFALKEQSRRNLEHQTKSLKEANLALSRARDAAQQASRAKSDFMANMSHEIRTPMNGIMGLTEVLLNSNLEPSLHKTLALVLSSAETLMTILNDILDFSKIEADKLAIDRQPFELRETLGDAVKLFGRRAHEKRLELSLRVAPEVPHVLVGDAGRIRQVLVNLVGNALKFTERGEVGVSVEVVQYQNTTARLRFQVSDTGIGIEESKHQMILEPFSQADTSTTRLYGGTGLGLTICQRLIDLMGGTLELASTPDVGTRISFEIDFDLETAPLATPLLEVQTLLNKVRILVVDDHATNRQILSEMLTAWQVDSTMLDSGIEVVPTLELAIEEQNPFDLVLMDTQLPQQDGFETTEMIRQSQLAKQTPVVMLGSCNAAAFTNRVRNLELSGYLTKPIKQSELLECILSVLSNPSPTSLQRSHAQTEDQKRNLRATTNELRPLKILVAEDNLVNQQLMLRVLSKAGHEVLLANHGLEAIQILETNSVDLVLMDVQMPHLDGYEATRSIRKAGRLSRSGAAVPIIALTANAMGGDREKCLAAGMDDYASKPIQFARLFELIAGLVPAQLAMSESGEDQTRTTCQTAETQTTESSASPDRRVLPVLDRDDLRDRIEGDLKLLAILFQAFAGDVNRQLAEVEQQIAAGNWQSAQQLAHTIKGTAANLGGIRVSKSASELERLLYENRRPPHECLQRVKQSAAELCAELHNVIAQQSL